jgi:hypothetical protein
MARSNSRMLSDSACSHALASPSRASARASIARKYAVSVGVAISRVPVCAARARFAASVKRPVNVALMAHCVQDAGPEQAVTARKGRAEGQQAAERDAIPMEREELGAWLRQQREARCWSRSEMVCQLIRAGHAANDASSTTAARSASRLPRSAIAIRPEPGHWSCRVSSAGSRSSC